MNREDIEGGKSFVFWAVLVTVVVLILGGVAVLYSAMFQPALQEIHTQTVRQSNQYRATKESTLVDKMESWTELDSKAALYKSDPKIVEGFRAQQAVLIRQMKMEAERLEPSQVPPDVRAFLAKQGERQER